jgi:TRAP-type C4-dicarboxylate transport system permease small subunit
MSWLVRALVATALLAMMVITCLDVIGRYLINRPLPGAAELVQ